MPVVVSPEIWSVKRVCELITRQRILPTVTDRLDPDEVVSFFEAVRAKHPLGTLILAEVAGDNPTGYTVVDGRYRIEAIARVLCPWQFEHGESVQVHLTAFDQGGTLKWGPTGGNPSSLPLSMLTSSRLFAEWQEALHQYEKNAQRAKRVLNDAHAAALMLDTPILAYIVRGDGREDFTRIGDQANNRFGRTRITGQ